MSEERHLQEVTNYKIKTGRKTEGKPSGGKKRRAEKRNMQVIILNVYLGKSILMTSTDTRIPTASPPI